MIDLHYSLAPRCTRCDHRAILTLPGATCLVSASGRRLERFRCPDKHGWHVRNHAFEGGGDDQRHRTR